MWARSQMREHLVNETLELATTGGAGADVQPRLALIRQLVPPSIERDSIVADELNNELKATGWLDASVLEDNPPQLRAGRKSPLATKNLLEDTDGCGSPLLSADVRSPDDVIAF